MYEDHHASGAIVGTRPRYAAVFGTFLRNSLVREMTFRANFLIECLSSVTWMLMNLGFYLIIFQHTDQFGSGWGKWEFFVFLATTMIVNGIVQAFFMPNCEEVSELIRTGGLDFALLKPIDTQFLISLQKVDWSALANFVAGLLLLAISLVQLYTRPENPLPLTPIACILYPLFVACGVAIMYALMISLSATSIWLGRNQSLYDFWFYITNFSRYPMEIYEGPIGGMLRFVFTFIVPVLVVVNVPARLLARPLYPQASLDWLLPVFTLVAAVLSLLASRWLFQTALGRYRSASS
jgi:ABC-2 type transport system permease protein